MVPFRHVSRKPNLILFDMTGAFADPIQGSDVPLLPCRATTSVALRDIIYALSIHNEAVLLAELYMYIYTH